MRKIIQLMIIFYFILIPIKQLIAVDEKSYIKDAHCFPNPFDNENEITKIKFTIVSDVNINSVTSTIVIYNFNGKKVWTRQTVFSITNRETTVIIKWGGENDIGEKVANGLYYAKIIVEANNTLTEIVKILVE